MRYQWTKPSTLTSFHLSQLHSNIYSNNMFYDSSYGFVLVFLMVCFPALSYPQRPDVVVDICSILLQVHPILLIGLRHHFFCISVVSWTVIYSVLLCTKLFSVELKPKGVFFFSRLLSCFYFTLTENICCMLPLIPILLLEYLFIVSA